QPPRIATVLNGWGRLKNPKTAINAFSIIRREMPYAELFMYGKDFEEGGSASQWAHARNFHHHIHFRGYVRPPDLHNQLKAMTMLLHPSLEEACPMTLLEAMALGVPVVAGNDAGGVPWVLEEGKAGFLTNVRDPHEIARAILACI